MNALLIVDVQNDFCPGGALPAPEGNRVVPVINKMMEKFPIIIASRDMHPPESMHFKKWPKHCISGTYGAEFHPDLHTHKIQKEFHKGTSNVDDGYSAFEATNEDLYGFLKENRLEDIYITGLTTEYCVKNTALDSVKHGFKTYVLTDAIAAVEPHSDNEKKALDEMKNSNILLIASDEIVK
jgi:nicotinamidase/pyrazinamidase